MLHLLGQPLGKLDGCINKIIDSGDYCRNFDLMIGVGYGCDQVPNYSNNMVTRMMPTIFSRPVAATVWDAPTCTIDGCTIQIKKLPLCGAYISKKNLGCTSGRRCGGDGSSSGCRGVCGSAPTVSYPHDSGGG